MECLHLWSARHASGERIQRGAINCFHQIALFIAYMSLASAAGAQKIDDNAIRLNNSNLSTHLNELAQSSNRKRYIIEDKIMLNRASEMRAAEWYASSIIFDSNGQLFIFDNNFVLHLANSIEPSVSNQVIISAFPDNMRKGSPGSNGAAGTPGQIGSSPGANGGAGLPGQAGTKGNDGISAGNLTLVIDALPSLPMAFDLDGQSGGDGGNGGQGGTGGAGQSGFPARTSAFNCAASGGQGGNGGRGGDGGAAGIGGNPGRSGTLTIVIIQRGIAKAQIEEKFKLVGAPGERGKPGHPGGPGLPGHGGPGGISGGFCARGQNGIDGSFGEPGKVPSDTSARADPPQLVIIAY